MQSIEIMANHSCPTINLNAYEGKIEIRGNSMPENARAFYSPILDWIKEYSKSPKPVTEVIFQMNLLNTSSTKIFIDIFKILSIIVDSDNSVNIVWYYTYGDDDIQEVGVDFKEYTKAEFELVPVHD